MIKPIIYHSFEENEKIEKDLMAQIPYEKRKAVAKELMSIFYNASRKKSAVNSHTSNEEKLSDSRCESYSWTTCEPLT
jgi:hypothetical protein